jgi:hypothetical protein
MLQNLRNSFHGNFCFCKNPKFLLKYWYSKHFFNENKKFQVTYSPTCLVRPVLGVLSQLSCPSCPVLAVYLFQLPCSGHIGHCSSDTTIMLWQSCHLCHFQAHLSRLPVGPACRDYPVPTVLSQMSCPGCPVPDVMS